MTSIPWWVQPLVQLVSGALGAAIALAIIEIRWRRKVKREWKNWYVNTFLPLASDPPPKNVMCDEHAYYGAEPCPECERVLAGLEPSKESRKRSPLSGSDLAFSSRRGEFPTRPVSQSTVEVHLFKPNGKYYTTEDWLIPDESFGPHDMERSPDFRRIDGGAVYITNKSPWGFPTLLIGESDDSQGAQER